MIRRLLFLTFAALLLAAPSWATNAAPTAYGPGGPLPAPSANTVACSDAVGWATCPVVRQLHFNISGAPIASMVLPVSSPDGIKFNANFASSTGVPAAFGSCNSAPAETDTWTVSCMVSSVWTQIGTIALTTSCSQAGAGVTFATTSGTAKTCDTPSRIEVVAPVTVSGTNESFTLVGHF